LAMCMIRLLLEVVEVSVPRLRMQLKVKRLVLRACECTNGLIYMCQPGILFYGSHSPNVTGGGRLECLINHPTLASVHAIEVPTWDIRD
jgi:hypothetical protein